MATTQTEKSLEMLNGAGRIYHAQRNRETQTEVGAYSASLQQLGVTGKWAAICWTHGAQIVVTDLRSEAVYMARHPGSTGFCEDCTAEFSREN